MPVSQEEKRQFLAKLKKEHIAQKPFFRHCREQGIPFNVIVKMPDEQIYRFVD